MTTPTTVIPISEERAAHLARELAHDFATRAAQHDHESSFPFENFDRLHEAGLLNLTIPRELGGGGIGLTGVFRVIGTLAQGDASTALVLTMHYLQHVNIARNRTWPSQIHEHVVRESLEGIALINAARVEPELGTPARGGLPATTAARTPGGWQISGRKIYTTGSPILRYATVWAKTDEDPVRVGSFLVPLASPGIRLEKTWNHLGMRATGSDDLVLEKVEVPADHAVDVRLPKDWQGGDPQAGHQGSLVLSALYNGIAVAARDWLVPYLKERIPANLGAPLASLPRFQVTLGEIEALLMINERLIAGLAEDYEHSRRKPSGVEPGLVKSVVTNNAVKAVKLAVDLIGNPGLTRDNPLERYYRDVLCGPVHTPQDDTVLAAAGQWSLARG